MFYELFLFKCGFREPEFPFYVDRTERIIVNCMGIKSAKKFGICPEVFCIKWESREILTIYPETEDRR